MFALIGNQIVIVFRTTSGDFRSLCSKTKIKMEIIGKLIKESKSKMNIRNWSEWSDILERKSLTAKLTGELESFKVDSRRIFEVTTQGRTENNIKDMEELNAYLRFKGIRDKIKKMK